MTLRSNLARSASWRHRASRTLASACLALPAFGYAAITDPAGDFLPTFAGSTASADLDVLSASVLFDAVNDRFTLITTLAGRPGATATGFYVWGVDRGAGTAGFAANGLPHVLFDTVVLVRPNGTGSVGATSLDAGAVTISGNTITAVVRGSLLPSTGFAEAAYQWNLWPRDGAFTGFAAISDFAPDTTDFATTALVPEPQTYALMAAGLAVVGVGARRRRRRG